VSLPDRHSYIHSDDDGQLYDASKLIGLRHFLKNKHDSRDVFRGGRTGAPPLNSANISLMQIAWRESLKFGQLTLGKIII